MADRRRKMMAPATKKTTDTAAAETKSERVKEKSKQPKENLTIERTSLENGHLHFCTIESGQHLIELWERQVLYKAEGNGPKGVEGR